MFAVLVSSVVLGVGVSILNISRKEILLTAGAQDSQYAFYAADAGYECALYEDFQNSAFSSTTATDLAVNCGQIAGASYASYVSIVDGGDVGVNNAHKWDYLFSLPVSDAGSCAAVDVTKLITTTDTDTTDADGNTVVIETQSASTTVLSDGFNVGWENESPSGDCNAYDASKVERALQATY